MVLQADPAGLQVPLGRRGNAQVANLGTARGSSRRRRRKALRVLRAHTVGVLDGMLVVDRRMLREPHGLRVEDGLFGVVSSFVFRSKA